MLQKQLLVDLMQIILWGRKKEVLLLLTRTMNLDLIHVSALPGSREEEKIRRGCPSVAGLFGIGITKTVVMEHHLEKSEVMLHSQAMRGMNETKHGRECSFRLGSSM
jgi:hypothetical protein